MASFVAKQMVGKKITGALDDKEDKNDNEIDPEIEEARREAEEKRREKYRKQEEEREQVRQGIRDKYGIKKKDKDAEEASSLDRRLGRKKKAPADVDVAPPPVYEPPPPSPGGLEGFMNNASEKCIVQ